MSQRRKSKFRIGAAFVLLCLIWAGCNRPRQQIAPDYVIKAGEVVVTRDQFLAELDLKLSNYPYDIKKSPERYNEVVVDLVATLSEESLLLAAAAKNGVVVSETDLRKAKEKILEDYPEESFEQMLLENAVSVFLWEQKLKHDLIIDKFIREHLMEKVAITPRDVKQFFDRTIKSRQAEGRSMADETRLIEQLKMQKGQAGYREWIRSLEQKLPVHVNKKAVTGLLIDPKHKGMSNG